MELKTDRLNIRPVSIEDIESIFKYRSDSETNKYQGWIPKKKEEVEAFISGISKEINIPETWFQFVIIEQQSNLLIGDLGIHFIDPENNQVEVGCTLNKEYHGKGYATEALRSIIEYLLNTLKKHRIVTSIDPSNLNSIKLVKRLGFRKEAHFVESLFINGEWVDDVVFALLASDWEKIEK